MKLAVFFFQAEDGIRDVAVTGVQTCALPISPVFSDVKLRRGSSGGIVPGTLLDYSYTVEPLKPVMPGDFQRAWRVTTGRLTRRSRYVLDVPANLAVRVKEVNLTFPRTVVEGRGRRVYTWATADVPKIEREPFAADSNGIDQYI